MFNTTSLSRFGVEIEGVHLSDSHSNELIARIRETWMENGLAVFRDQGELSEETLVRFSRRFGELEIHIRKEYLSPENPEVLYVSNVREGERAVGILSDHEVGWHHDQIYLEKPALGSLLHGVIIPPAGGNTEFVNLNKAWEALDPTLQQSLDGLKAVQSYAFFNGSWSEPTSDEQSKSTPDVRHPLIRTHPETGKKAIYADPGMTPLIAGIDKEDSRRMLDEIFAHCQKPEFRYVHEWRLGDVLMWDNASTMHKRGEFDPSSQRLMKRTTILPPADRAIPR